MSRSRAEIARGWIRWLPLTAAFAVVPKCVVCLAAYAGAGAALGVKLGTPELCGASAASLHHALAWCVAFGAVIALAGGLWTKAKRHARAGVHGRGHDFGPEFVKRQGARFGTPSTSRV